MDREEIYRGLWQIRDHDLALLVAFLAAKGIDLMKSPLEALQYCTERAEANDPMGQHALAKLLWTGLAGQRDDRAAFSWCSRASSQGHLPSIVMQAGFYTSGIGVEADAAKGLGLLEAAAKAGSADALGLLGTVHEEGLGVPRNHTKAIEVWKSAAEKGNAEAQCALGRTLVASPNAGEASQGVRWLQTAANQGLPSAHYALANLYETGGGGLRKDKELSEHHRAQAAAFERE